MMHVVWVVPIILCAQAKNYRNN